MRLWDHIKRDLISWSWHFKWTGYKEKNNEHLSGNESGVENTQGDKEHETVRTENERGENDVAVERRGDI